MSRPIGKSSSSETITRHLLAWLSRLLQAACVSTHSVTHCYLSFLDRHSALGCNHLLCNCESFIVSCRQITCLLPRRLFRRDSLVRCRARRCYTSAHESARSEAMKPHPGLGCAYVRAGYVGVLTESKTSLFLMEDLHDLQCQVLHH